MIRRLIPLIPVLASPMIAIAQPQTTSGPEHQWANVCNASTLVTDRVGQVTPADIQAGIETLQASGLVERITQQTNDEACLTLIASGETGSTTFVVNKPLPATLPPAENPAMPFKPMEQALTDKLEKLDLGFFVPAPGANADPKYRALYEAHPKEAKRSSWYSLTLQSRASQRSMSAFFEGYCLIINETSPLAEYSRVGFRGDLSGSMSHSDRQWMKTYGDAMEFWHEAAHCQLNPIGQVERPQRTETIMTNARDFSAECDSSFAEDVFNMTLGLQAISASNLQAYAKDLRILYQLATEAYSDDLANRVLAKRLGTGVSGCVPAENRVDNPWGKFRLADSVKNPSIIHMTWVGPFLSGQTLPNQAHALSDSWAALKEISFDEVSVPGKESLLRKVLTGRAKGDHLTPTPAPDQARKEQWKAWIKGKLGL